MRKNTFVIETELVRHRLFLNGQEIGTFTTLGTAEKEAAGLAQRATPGVKLRFELAYKSTLSDLEIRVATVETESNHRSDFNDRCAVGRSSICGS